MKIKIILATSVIFLSVLTISCSKSKAPTTNNTSPIDTTHHTDIIASIVGRWEADSIHISATISGYPIGEEDTSFVHGQSIIQIFSADSTVVLIDNAESPADTATGKYYVANGILYARYSGDSSYTSAGSYTISNNQLIIQQTTDSLGAVIISKLYSTKQ